MNLSQPITDIKRLQSDKNSTVISNKQTQEQSQKNSRSAESDNLNKLQQNSKILCQKSSRSNYGSNCIKSENTSKVLNMATEIDNSSFQNNQIKLSSYNKSSISSMRNLSNQGPNLSGQLTNIHISNSKISRFHVNTFKKDQCQLSQSLRQEVEKSGEISSKQSTTKNTQSQREIVRNFLENSSKNTSESYLCKSLSFGFGKRRIEQHFQQFSLINVEEIEPYILQYGSSICYSETLQDLLKEMDGHNISILDRNPQKLQSQMNVSFQMQSFIQIAIVQIINSRILVDQPNQQSQSPNQCPKKRKKIKKKNKSSYLANQSKYTNQIEKYFESSEMIQLSNIDFLSTENIQIEISSEYTKQLGNDVCEWQTQAFRYLEQQSDYKMQFS